MRNAEGVSNVREGEAPAELRVPMRTRRVNRGSAGASPSPHSPCCGKTRELPEIVAAALQRLGVLGLLCGMPTEQDAQATVDRTQQTLADQLWHPAAIAKQFEQALPGIIGGVVVIALFWLLAVAARWVVRGIGRNRKIDPTLVRLMGKAAYLGLLTCGIISGLGTMGINVGAMVAGLGLTGFALGFALKDIVSNLLAGVLVILYSTFDEGDKIRVSGFEGKVVRIDLRYTLLDTGPDIVFLPNQMLFNNAVVVLGTEPGGTSEAAVAGG